MEWKAESLVRWVKEHKSDLLQGFGIVALYGASLVLISKYKQSKNPQTHEQQATKLFEEAKKIDTLRCALPEFRRYQKLVIDAAHCAM